VTNHRYSCRLCFGLDSEPELSDCLINPKVLINSAKLAIVEDLVPLVAGHLLIVTRAHQPAIGGLPTEEIQDVETYVKVLRAEYEERGQSVVTFEHGSKGPGEAGSCIDHAHVHIVPSTRQITATNIVASPFLKSAGLTDWRSMRGLNDLTQLYRYMSYLWIQDSSGAFAVTVTTDGRSVPCQALRRWCAEALGLAEWDWHLAPHVQKAEYLHERK